jgi:hypothetical protein
VSIPQATSVSTTASPPVQVLDFTRANIHARGGPNQEQNTKFVAFTVDFMAQSRSLHHILFDF